MEIYSGTETSHGISGKGPTRHYYRVKARNTWGNSSWSDVEWIDVVWEREPNDTSAQAKGATLSGLTYYGTLPASDTNDYFYFDLSSAGSVELWLTEIPGGCDYDLVLRDVALSIVGYSGNVGNANEHVLTAALSPGRYYVRVYHRSAAGSTQAYHLRAVYP